MEMTVFYRYEKLYNTVDNGQTDKHRNCAVCARLNTDGLTLEEKLNAPDLKGGGGRR